MRSQLSRSRRFIHSQSVCGANHITSNTHVLLGFDHLETCHSHIGWQSIPSIVHSCKCYLYRRTAWQLSQRTDEYDPKSLTKCGNGKISSPILNLLLIPVTKVTQRKCLISSVVYRSTGKKRFDWGSCLQRRQAASE